MKAYKPTVQKWSTGPHTWWALISWQEITPRSGGWYNQQREVSARSEEKLDRRIQKRLVTIQKRIDALNREFS